MKVLGWIQVGTGMGVFLTPFVLYLICVMILPSASFSLPTRVFEHVPRGAQSEQGRTVRPRKAKAPAASETVLA